MSPYSSESAQIWLLNTDNDGSNDTHGEASDQFLFGLARNCGQFCTVRLKHGVVGKSGGGGQLQHMESLRIRLERRRQWTGGDHDDGSGARRRRRSRKFWKHERAGPDVSNRAQETLQQFCQWQHMLNDRNDDALNHHDVAILLTRHDICRATNKCDTLGLAELGTMCDGRKSCAIIEDNGLSAAFTIAHELGHVFNIPHDDERKCAEFMPLNKHSYHIMAPTLEYNTNPWSLSSSSEGTVRIPNGLSNTGVQKAFRDCDSPRPENGGKYCVGQRERYRPCSVQDCPWDMPGFRELQCTEFDGTDIGIHGVPKEMKWVPKYTGVADNERCRLYCRGTDSAAFYLLKDKVADGTPCDRNGDDICIDGTCHKVVGEEGVHRRLPVHDRDCSPVGFPIEIGPPTSMEIGSLKRSTFGYNKVLRIPAGAAGIDITQTAHNGQKEDDNYLALRTFTGEFLLNGQYQVSVFRQQIPILDTVLECGQPDEHPLPFHDWALGQHVRCADSFTNRPVAEAHCAGIQRPDMQKRACNVDCFYKYLQRLNTDSASRKWYQYILLHQREGGAGVGQQQQQAQQQQKLMAYSPSQNRWTVHFEQSKRDGNFDNLKTILTKSMAEQTIRQWTVDEEEVYTPNLNAARVTGAHYQ
ncbi:hypothetical protein GPALN_003288 [Globodera pallida]|nr:hypothetical protein GPALN_003288 [Globodera pallida]